MVGRGLTARDDTLRNRPNMASLLDPFIVTPYPCGLFPLASKIPEMFGH